MAGSAENVVQMGSAMFALGLRFAAPVIAAMMISNAALGVIARAVPQMNVLMMAFPVHISLGLLVLGITLPMIATFYSSWSVTYDDLEG